MTNTPVEGILVKGMLLNSGSSSSRESVSFEE